VIELSTGGWRCAYAATFLREYADCFPDGFVPSNPAQLAILAIKVYDVFVNSSDASDSRGRAPTDLEVAEAVIKKMRQFEASGPRKRDAPGSS
jgi:hypothetical protein